MLIYKQGGVRVRELSILWNIFHDYDMLKPAISLSTETNFMISVHFMLT